MDDDFGDDVDFTAIADATERTHGAKPSVSGSTSNAPRVQQPTPQALPTRAGPSSILVSARQKGNPSLNYIKSLPWEYSDIPADYVLGATTCALFLSLKYHRLHPEYIYSRIKALGHKYNLRILLTMIDIQNHEESLRELSKTSLINNLTLILCWSAQEAGRYLELYKSYEHASPTSIRAHQATSYAEKLVEFITVPRSINKTDAVSLVSAFGSVRAAVNARPEEIGEITGWGEKKVQRWCGTVQENFRVRKAAKRRVGLDREGSSIGLSRNESSMGFEREESHFEDSEDPISGPEPVSINRTPLQDASNWRSATTSELQQRPAKRQAQEVPLWEPGEDEEEALFLAAAEEGRSATNDTAAETATSARLRPKSRDTLDEGIAAALAKLRKQ